MMNRTILSSMCFTLTLTVLGCGTNATETDTTEGPSQPSPEEAGEGDWLSFANDVEIESTRLFEQQGAVLGLKEHDEMRLTRQDEDELGFTHLRYQQYHKGIRVEGAEYTVHALAGRVQKANGRIVRDLDVDTALGVDEKTALEAALGAIDAKHYTWEDPEHERQIKLDTGDASATHCPMGERVIVRMGSADGALPEALRLAFRFEVQSLMPRDHVLVYIDAETGRVLLSQSLFLECSTGSMVSLYNGNQSFSTQQRGLPNNDYILRDDCRGDIHTKWAGACSWSLCPEISDSDNQWSTVSQKPATSAHWSAQKSHDYFLDAHGRSGTNNANKPLHINAGWGQQNASYHYAGSSLDELFIGSMGGNSLATLDVIGHEFAHGVTRHTANLTYSKESGALNESFSDIFGAMVERSVEGNGFNWLIGEDALTLRSMSQPEGFNQPSTYLGPHWVNTAGCSPTSGNDYCGVHTNSGVQNKWFYLLAVGGTHNGKAVIGIGADKAAKIAYRNLTVYLQSSSTYAAARQGAISAARDLYGPCSQEVIETTNAWSAVGVGALALPAPWTQWYDRDNPSGTGDWEARVDQLPAVCVNPVGVECTTLNGVKSSLTGETVTCTPQTGFICKNAEQQDGICQDYKVRFCCP